MVEPIFDPGVTPNSCSVYDATLILNTAVARSEAGIRRKLGKGGRGQHPTPICVLRFKIPEGWGGGRVERNSGIQEVATGFRNFRAVGHGWQRELGRGGAEWQV